MKDASETSVSSLVAIYETHARACDPKDFQGQVMRNPGGKSVGPDQVAMILDAIGRGLELTPDDVVLDLCCGNGAITDPILARCRGGLGIDFTPYLIEVAKTNFESPPERLYRRADVAEHVETTEDTERFTKAFFYGAFQCLPQSTAVRVLLALRRRFPKLTRIFLGNLPDLDRVGIFCGTEIPPLEELRSSETLVGIWRTEQEVRELAAECGWHADFSRMPARFYGARYRFDATLTHDANRSAPHGAAG
jgi:SAM-dependent methyltransferase